MAAHILGGRALRRDALATFDRLPGSADFQEAVVAEPADLYIANDWRALPAVHHAARYHKAKYSYDAAEWSVGEFIERRTWRLVFPNLIKAIETQFIHDAAFVTTVGPSLAELFETFYGLKSRPTVIRNLPRYEHSTPRASDGVIRVLYHGQFLPNRGLEPLIRSVRMWPHNFRLQLRGYGPGSYEQYLQRLARSTGGTDRIEFLGKAKMTDLIELASTADVGIHPLQDVSQQTRFSLPNKLFEYIMAGLAVCVSNLPDMHHVVESFQIGKTLSETSSSGIANTLQELSCQQIQEFKQNSLKAAKILCWESEQETLVELVDHL